MADPKQLATQLKDKGNAALKEENYEEAIKHYTDAIALDSTNHLFYSNRSAAYASAKKYEEALNDADKTIEILPNWGKGYSRKGAALEYLNRLPEAIEAYKTGLQNDPSNQQLKESLQGALAKERRQSSQDNGPFGNPFSNPTAILKLAGDSRTKDWLGDPSFMAMLRDLQANPKSVSKYMQSNDPRFMTALSVLLGIDVMTVPGDDQDSTDVHMNDATPEPPKPQSQPKSDLSPEKQQAQEQKELGNQAYRVKNFEQALEFYNKAVSLDPTDMTFLNNIAAIFFEQKNYDECIKQCEKAVEVGRENRADFKLIAKSYARIAASFFKTKDYVKAKYYYEKSLAEHRTPETRAKLSEVEKVMKEEEIKAYVDPEKSLQEKEKGNEYFQKGNYPDALKHYTEAIKRNPQDAKLFSNRAACYTKLAEFQLALKDCEECIRLDPTFVRGYMRRATVLMAMKEYSRASMAYQKVMELEPENKEAMDGYRQCMMASSVDPEEVRKKAMTDPDVQNILRDPAMRLILEQMREDPKALNDHLKNPEVATKIQKLIESGLVAIR